MATISKRSAKSAKSRKAAKSSKKSAKSSKRFVPAAPRTIRKRAKNLLTRLEAERAEMLDRAAAARREAAAEQAAQKRDAAIGRDAAEKLAQKKRGYAFDELSAQRLRRKVREMGLAGVSAAYGVEQSAITARLEADPAWKAWGRAPDAPSVRTRSEALLERGTRIRTSSPRARKSSPGAENSAAAPSYAEGCEWHLKIDGRRICELPMELRVISGDGERRADCCVVHAQAFLTTKSTWWEGAREESIPAPFRGSRNERLIEAKRAELKLDEGR